MTGPRRLSHAISEGDGISLIVAVDGPQAAREAEERGAEAVLVPRRDGVAEIRAATGLPIVRFLGDEHESGEEDACIVGAREADAVLSDDVELVVWVAHEDELEEALERFDPELVVLASRDAGRAAAARARPALGRPGRQARDRRHRRRDDAGRAGRARARRDRRGARAQRGVTRERRNAAAIGVAVFIAGAVLLGLEIAASRVLAPSFGSSLYVWGALIGVVLAGLSIGYWLGGALADRLPTPRLLVGMLALGALLVLAIPFVDAWVLEQVVAWDPGPRLDPLVATIVLFGVPAVILGGVSPVAVRLRGRELEHLGRTAGRLFAVSTAGSIAGTFLTAFWLIPEFGTDQLLAASSVALLVAAAVVASAERLVFVFVVLVATAAAGVGAVVSLAPESGGSVTASQLRNWSPVYRQRGRPGPLGDPADAQEGYDVLFAKDSQYHRIAVVQDDSSRYLRFDSSFQSGMYRDNPYRTRFAYTDYLQLALAYQPGAKRILFVGLGGGSAPKRMWRDFPGLQVDVVELDREVVGAARRFFGVPRDRRLAIEVEDGRRFLARQRRTVGRDRRRRVLLGRDPLPSRHAGVPRARPLAAAGPAASSSRTSSAPFAATSRASSARCCGPTAPSSRPLRSIRCSRTAIATSAASGT